MTKNRIFYYDFLRAVAIVMVILCHVDGMIGYGFTNLKSMIPGLITTVTFVGVPIFLMLSGALLLNKSYSLSEFFKKRFTRIFYPYLFWIIITIIIGILFFEWSNQEALEVFFGIISPSWYVWTLIGIYLIIPVINSFLKEYDLKGLEFLLIIWAITFLLEIHRPHLLGSLNLEYFAGYAGYVVLGYYLDNKQFPLSERKIFLIGMILFITFTVIRMFIFKYELDNFTDYYMLITTLMQSAGLFLAVKYLDRISINTKNIYSKIKSGIAGKAIVSISLCSYGMYLIHYIIIEYFDFCNIKSLKLLIPILIVTVILSWLAVYLCSKIPHLKKFSGA